MVEAVVVAFVLAFAWWLYAKRRAERAAVVQHVVEVRTPEVMVAYEIWQALDREHVQPPPGTLDQILYRMRNRCSYEPELDVLASIINSREVPHWIHRSFELQDEAAKERAAAALPAKPRFECAVCHELKSSFSTTKGGRICKACARNGKTVANSGTRNCEVCGVMTDDWYAFDGIRQCADCKEKRGGRGR